MFSALCAATTRAPCATAIPPFATVSAPAPTAPTADVPATIIAATAPSVDGNWVVVTIQPFYCWLFIHGLKWFEFRRTRVSKFNHVRWLVRSSLVDADIAVIERTCEFLEAKTNKPVFRRYREEPHFPRGGPVFLCTQGNSLMTNSSEKWSCAHPLGNILNVCDLRLPDSVHSKGNVCNAYLDAIGAADLTQFYMQHCVSAGIPTGTVCHEREPNPIMYL